MAARLARHRYAPACFLATLVAGAAVVLFRRIGPTAVEHADLLFAPVLTGYALALIGLLSRRRAKADPPEWLDHPSRRWGLIFAVMLVPIVIGTWVDESAVAKLPWSNRQPTPAALLAGISCGDDMDRCAPSPGLVGYVRQHIPAEAVLAVDYRQVNEPTLFLPQQVDVWSGAIEGLVDPDLTFPVYFKHLERARAASLDQPFFNDRDTREERRTFLRDLEVTHVLVNPRTHAVMSRVLTADPDLFLRQYDDGRWALYEVRR